MLIKDFEGKKYESIKIEDKSITLFGKTNEIKMPFLKNSSKNFYIYTQEKKIHNSRMMFVNVTKHYINFDVNLNGFKFHIEGSNYEYNEIKDILDKVGFEKKDNILKYFPTKIKNEIKVNKIKEICFYTFGSSLTGLNDIGIGLTQGNKRNYYCYDELLMADDFINILLNENKEVEIKSDLIDENYIIFFYVFGSFLILSVTYFLLPLSFSMNLMFYIFLITINIFSIISSMIAISFKISELEKYEVILNVKSNYSDRRKIFIKKLLSIILIFNALIFIAKFVL